MYDFQIEYQGRKKAEGKKARDDKDAVLNMLFAAFEKHQYYNIKDLQKVQILLYTDSLVSYSSVALDVAHIIFTLKFILLWIFDSVFTETFIDKMKISGLQ